MHSSYTMVYTPWCCVTPCTWWDTFFLEICLSFSLPAVVTGKDCPRLYGIKCDNYITTKHNSIQIRMLLCSYSNSSKAVWFTKCAYNVILHFWETSLSLWETTVAANLSTITIKMWGKWFVYIKSNQDQRKQCTSVLNHCSYWWFICNKHSGYAYHPDKVRSPC